VSDDNTEDFSYLKDGNTNSSENATFYDDWAETYDGNLRDWNYRAPVEAAAMIAPHLNTGERVLDVGCGTGLFGKAMTEAHACTVDGLDISDASLDVARQTGAYDKLLCQDLQITPLPFDDNTFGAAACIGVMTYIEDVSALLADLCRMVRPGGHIVFTQRDDKWQDRKFDAVIADLEARDLWTAVTISDSKPYMPGNADFADDIKVIYVSGQVV